MVVGWINACTRERLCVYRYVGPVSSLPECVHEISPLCQRRTEHRPSIHPTARMASLTTNNSEVRADKDALTATQHAKNFSHNCHVYVCARLHVEHACTPAHSKYVRQARIQYVEAHYAFKVRRFLCLVTGAQGGMKRDVDHRPVVSNHAKDMSACLQKSFLKTIKAQHKKIPVGTTPIRGMVLPRSSVTFWRRSG